MRHNMNNVVLCLYSDSCTNVSSLCIELSVETEDLNVEYWILNVYGSMHYEFWIGSFVLSVGRYVVHSVSVNSWLFIYIMFDCFSLLFRFLSLLPPFISKIIITIEKYMLEILSLFLSYFDFSIRSLKRVRSVKGIFREMHSCDIVPNSIVLHSKWTSFSIRNANALHRRIPNDFRMSQNQRLSTF